MSLYDSISMVMDNAIRLYGYENDDDANDDDVDNDNDDNEDG